MTMASYMRRTPPRHFICRTSDRRPRQECGTHLARAVSVGGFALLWAVQKQKAAPRAAYPLDVRLALADGRCVGAGHGHRFAGLNDVSGLGVIRIRPGGDTESG